MWKACSQCSHLNGLTPSWSSMWRFNATSFLNLFPHLSIGQGNLKERYSAVCGFFLCFIKSLITLKPRPHSSHLREQYFIRLWQLFLKIRAYTGLFFFLSSSFSQYDDKYSTKFRLWQLTVISYQHIQVLFCCAETVTAKNWSMNFRKILQLIRTVNVIIALWRKSRFSRFPLKQEYAIPKVINSLRVYFWFN